MGILFDRSITHWTGGGGRANDKDRQHYHKITEFDGRIVDGKESIEDNVVTSDGDYAAHTLNLNTRSAGFAMAGMHSAVESPFDAGPSPINEKQFEAHCKMVAEQHAANAVPITRTTCLTHAEVEPTLGVKQRGKWDFTRLPFKPELRGALPVGDYFRERVQSYLPNPLPVNDNRPILRKGDRGIFVEDLQELLRSIRIFVGKVDGIFGPKTEGAVLAFQAKAGLVTDGKVGPNTWSALMLEPPVPDRHVDTEYLRQSGSRTIETADQGQKEVVVAAGATVGLGTIEVAMDAVEQFSGAGDTLSAAQDLLFSNWPILIIIGIGALAYFRGPQIMAAIRSYRTDDAQTGANLKL